MKKSFLRVAAVFMTIVTVALLLYGCRGEKLPNEGIDTVTDKNGLTYLAVEGSDGKTLAGITDASGNLYAAEMDSEGNVLTDGPLYSVSYNGELPTNDTTAVSINESKHDDFNYNQSVVEESNTTGANENPTGDTPTETTKPSTGSNTSTTKKPGNTSKPAKDKEKYLAEKYKKLFQSQTYYVEFTTDDDSVPEPITLAVKNGNIYMKTKFEGYDCTMIYQKKNDKVYIVLPTFHVYCKMNSDVMDDLNMDFADVSGVKSVDVYDVMIGNRECRCEEYSLKDGSTSNYYFYNNELVRIDQISAKGDTSIMSITKIDSSVDDSLFNLPKGYVPVDLSKLDLGEGKTEK